MGRTLALYRALCRSTNNLWHFHSGDKVRTCYNSSCPADMGGYCARDDHGEFFLDVSIIIVHNLDSLHAKDGRS
jgi:hypothetical protein